MARNVKLLLTENVDSLGIVGDIVNVRVGYARNYLLPFGYATTPSDELVAQLAEKRAQAEKQLAERRAQREEMIGKLNGQELTLIRACNDQGQLYGSVTQQDISSALKELGFNVAPREVRLPTTIKRVDTFDIHIKVDSDLEADIKLWVVADRELDTEDNDEMEFDNEGELIIKDKKPAKSEAQPEAEAEAGAEA
ncbi:MAG: 50S ribosomal protein L9 [Phycisphaerae bacterium]|nr:50S ribosomal protein L9 [Phycisphaerae bacterium]MBM91192.1 50S ribosomal protein L9 [Phycisphaerae bacterium]HCT45352.1 50S ribosomal protein L9 [Phycisphaerales bacterium]|tara:strand:+ start:47 stop:631 length:585 start_codon:yes stop_codon:yes gene_type:complete